MVYSRDFSQPDRVFEMAGLWSGRVEIGAGIAAFSRHQPGWRWSSDARAPGSEAWCQTRHVGYSIAGACHIVLSDGTEFEVAAGSVFDIPPGHDAWVTSEIPWETIDWVGTRSWLAEGAPSTGVLATILFTDVVDSSREVRRRGDVGWSDINAALEERTSDLVASFGGRVVKFTGDGALAVFDGIGRAVRCGLVLVAAAPHLGLCLRAGIHTGEVETAGEDIVGLAVHETARILALAGPGEVLVSEVTRSLAGGAGLEFVDRGLQELKGIGPRRVFEATTTPKQLD